MVYEERNTWVGLIVSVIAMTVYVIVVLQQAAGGPLTDVDCGGRSCCGRSG